MKRAADRPEEDFEEDLYGPLPKVIRYSEMSPRTRKRTARIWGDDIRVRNKKPRAFATGGTPVKEPRIGKSFSLPPQRSLLLQLW